MSNIRGKVVAITGASSGIGEAAARLLAERGAKVVLGARRTERLETIVRELRARDREAVHQRLDVTARGDVESFVRFACQSFGRVDVLINNAGIMPLSPLEQRHVDEWDRMIDVNIKGVLYGIAAALPRMKEQGGGHFINVSSIAAHRVVHTAAVYSATKFAVNAISEGLRQEGGETIRVTVISPGPTTSELPNTISDPATKAFVEQYRKAILPAEAIARAIAFAVEQPADVDVNEIIVRPTAQG
ncbi:SDR family oxidoreductase [Pendulispora albinea]|uniref:SDR family oxidoreductase n=1 Tax=Pendulispora albinea TaxID=2741071 RepID=A0ABZ2LRE6_9BACT